MREVRPHFKKCPSCGSAKIKRVRGPYHTKAHRKPIVVPGVLRHECPVCGEVLLDYEAVKKIEECRFKSRPGRLARPA